MILISFSLSFANQVASHPLELERELKKSLKGNSYFKINKLLMNPVTKYQRLRQGNYITTCSVTWVWHSKTNLSNPSKTQQWPQISQIGRILLKKSWEREFLDGLLQWSKDTLNSRHNALQVRPLHLEGLHQHIISCLGVPLCDRRQCLDSSNPFLDLWLKPFMFDISGSNKAAHIIRTIPKLKLKLKLELSQPLLTIVLCLRGGWHKDVLGWLWVVPTSGAILLQVLHSPSDAIDWPNHGYTWSL
jgi:hypothetical protein